MPKVTHPKARIQLRRKESTDKLGYLRVVFRWNGNLLSYNLNHCINNISVVEAKYWDVKAGETIYNKKYGQTYIDINKKLKEVKAAVEKIYQSQPDITLKEFKLELDYFTGRTERPTSEGKRKLPLFEFIAAYIEDAQVNGKRGTWKKFITVQNHLKTYATENNINLSYEKINWRFRSKFLQWLYAPPRSHATNNAAKTFEVLKQFLQESSKLEYHDNQIFLEKGFGVKRAKTKNKTVFSFSELEVIRNADLSNNPRLERVRDLFMVGCYTGLRFSDWHKVNRDNIINEGNEQLLEISTQKTDTEVYIPCLPELLAILEKYDYALPTLSAQKFNKYIKEVVQIALPDQHTKLIFSKAGNTETEIVPKHEVVSSHCARRSFATNFFEIGIPAPVLMQITGHTTEKQFFDYVDANKKKLAAKFAAMVKANSQKRILKAVK